MIRIETLADFVEHGYELHPYCPYCKRHGPPLDLKRYVVQGKGQLRPKDLRVRHERCKTLLELRVRPPSRHRK